MSALLHRREFVATALTLLGYRRHRWLRRWLKQPQQPNPDANQYRHVAGTVKLQVESVPIP